MSPLILVQTHTHTQMVGSEKVGEASKRWQSQQDLSQPSEQIPWNEEGNIVTPVL
jgi:hypothetical protein